MMPPTSVCSSRIGVCSEFAPAVLDLSARALANGIMARGSSKPTHHPLATGWLDDINHTPSWDIYADVASRWDCQNYYGYDKWFAGHRNGATGLNDPYTPDIARYKAGIQWIQNQIDSDYKYRTDDTRFWVDIPPI